MRLVWRLFDEGLTRNAAGKALQAWKALLAALPRLELDRLKPSAKTGEKRRQLESTAVPVPPRPRPSPMRLRTWAVETSLSGRTGRLTSTATSTAAPIPIWPSLNTRNRGVGIGRLRPKSRGAWKRLSPASSEGELERALEEARQALGRRC